MIKVMIVDDEALQRRLVRAVIDWEALGMSVVGEAKDGRQAVELARQTEPDIIVMDINIPHINGLEAARQIKVFLPHVQVLILSAYGEFTYAQEALRIGAIRFVLKPLEPEELLAALASSCQNLQAIIKAQETLQAMQHEQKRIRTERFLMEQLTRNNDQDCSECFKQQQLILPTWVQVIQLRGETQILDDAQEIITELFPDALFLSMDNLLCALIGTAIEEDLALRFHTLLTELRTVDCLQCGVSEPYASAQGLNAAWKEADAALRSCCAEQPFCAYETQSQRETTFLLSVPIDQFNSVLRSQDVTAVRDFVRNSFARLCSVNASPPIVFHVALSLLICATCYLTDRGVETTEWLVQKKKMLERSSSDIPATQQVVLQLLDEGYVFTNSIPSTRRKVEEAMRIIREQYSSSELGLNLIANTIGVNPSYLSNVFKAECGFSLTRYILQVRMEQARKRMLANRTLTVNTVALSVGYTDAYYFSKSFKKYFGVTPSRFLDEHQG